MLESYIIYIIFLKGLHEMAEKTLEDYIEDSKKYDEWKIGNQVLLDLCKNYPKHEKKDEIIAKIWLIGRSYAVALERCKQDEKKNTHDFYVEAAEKIIKSNFDEKLDKLKCKNGNRPTDEIILGVYHSLLKTLSEYTNMNKISFASKYLHFHFPELFYIYDSRAAKKIGKVIKMLGIAQRDYILPPENNENINPELPDNFIVYKRFYKKCQVCVQRIKETLHIELSSREFDSLLLTIADEKEKENNQ